MAVTDQSPYIVAQQQAADTAPFMICAMFTSSYAHKAQRLANSLQKLNLPHSIFQVPAVHRSISPSGTDDFTYCKPSFIAWALNAFQKPILYVDADCVFCDKPNLIFNLTNEGVDFAIYNWLSDLMNDAWTPHALASSTHENEQAARYWRFSHSCDNFSAEQVMCSGAVQFWRNAAGARSLLQAWKEAIHAFQAAPDDECLDFAFNVTLGKKFDGKYFWLPKEYLRCIHWIYARPVIDHPEIPTPSNIIRPASLGDKRFDTKQLIMAGKARPLPRACIVDAAEKLLLMPSASGVLKPAARLPLTLYL